MYPLCHSAEDFNDVFKESQAVQRYKQLLPTLFTSVSPVLPSKLAYIPIDTYIPHSASTPKMKYWGSPPSEPEDIMFNNSKWKTSFPGATEVPIFIPRYVRTVQIARTPIPRFRRWRDDLLQHRPQRKPLCWKRWTMEWGNSQASQTFPWNSI